MRTRTSSPSEYTEVKVYWQFGEVYWQLKDL